MPKTIPNNNNQKWTMLIGDKTLRNVLSSWSRRAGWQLYWKAKGDLPIQANWTITGSYESAINSVLKSSQHTDMPLKAVMYDANKVLEISSGQ